MEQTLNKKRKMCSTPEQYRLYLEMLESDINYRENKISPDNPTAANFIEKWGSTKNLTGVEKGISRLEMSSEKKSPNHKKFYSRNEGEPEKELTEAEKKLLYLIGNIVVEGIAGVPELGVENQTSIDTAIQVEQIEQNIEIVEREKATKVTAKALLVAKEH